jgi:hypothetical protein
MSDITHEFSAILQMAIQSTSVMKRLKELEDESRHLKKMYAEECLKAKIRPEALEGKL